MMLSQLLLLMTLFSCLSLANICPLRTGEPGTPKSIFECTTLSKLEQAPCTDEGYGGNHIKVCCPEKQSNSSFPQLSREKTPQQDICELYAGEQIPNKCANCKPLSQCREADFSYDYPPDSCGFDGATSEELFCCSSQIGSLIKIPQQPKFFQSSFQPWPCEDHTDQCQNWISNDGQSCRASSNTFNFMRYACMESCHLCGPSGCVDNFAKCEDWSRLGQCSERPEFMIFNCKESCGTCGFKSDFNKEGQTARGETYSDFNSAQFSCGRLRSKTPKLPPNPQRRFKRQIAQGQQDVAPCTSIVISDKFVITSGKCVNEHPIEPFGVRTVQIRTGTLFEETIEVKREFVHPYYRYPGVENNIAILELERRIIYNFDKYGDTPSCMGKSSNFEEQEAFVQGFGQTEDGAYSDELLEATVITMSNAECEKWVQHNFTTENEKVPRITQAILCTRGIYNSEKGIYSGPCKGDEGGPLFINTITNDNGDITGQTLVAINIGSAACGEKNVPAWYQRITSLYDWIDCVKTNAENATRTQEEIEENCSRIISQE